MISKCVLSVLFTLIIVQAFAQKKLLDYKTGDTWTRIISKQISGNGNYAFYVFGSAAQGNSLVVQSTDRAWKIEIHNCSNSIFNASGSFVIFLNANDSLGLLNLESKQIEFIQNVKSFKAAPMGDGNWLSYQLKNTSRELVLLNLGSGKRKTKSFVDNYTFNDQGDLLIYRSADTSKNNKETNLHWWNLTNGIDSVIWHGSDNIVQMAFDSSCTKLALIKTTEKGSFALLLFQNKDYSVRQLTEIDTFLKGNNLVLANQFNSLQFSRNGNYLFFQVKQRRGEARDSIKKMASLNIWNYNDYSLQSEQTKILENPNSNPSLKPYKAVMNLNTGVVFKIEDQNNELLGELTNYNNQFLLIKHTNGGSYTEASWNERSKVAVFLLCLQDGKKILIKEKVTPLDLSNFQLSPDGRFVLYFDFESKNYFTFNTVSKKTTSITKNITVPLFFNDFGIPNVSRPFGYDIFDKTHFVFIYDEYDVWKVDLSGNSKPFNISAGYGRRNKIVLRTLSYGRVVDIDSSLVLVAFNTINKENGFVSVKPAKTESPVPLTMGPFIYYYRGLRSSSASINSSKPIKAKYSNCYLLERMSESEAPNLFYTTDFKTFVSLTSFAPQNQFNWLTTELVRWKLPSGKATQGILYKPENFDATKKYPVIIHFYEKNSDGLHSFNYPELSNGEMNIPYFVSNGYVVFDPDIQYQIGEPGKSALDAVTSAAKHISKWSWVDSTKIGLQGISFGGYQINYILCHSNIFAAAAESAGPSDFISGYGSINGNGLSYQFLYERGQNRINATLWDDPQRYILNSPIFYANKVQTPLLIMHNPSDKQVPFNQGLEFFLALRRLGKKVWLLEYDNEQHGLINDINRLDYTTRLDQFFNHYLKNILAPKWMTRGIPAKMKGLDDGLELDKEIQTPGDGLLMSEEKRK